MLHYHYSSSRLKSKHESELHDVESEVRTLRDKLGAVRKGAAAAEEANIVLRADIRQKDVELAEVKKVNKMVRSIDRLVICIGLAENLKIE